MKLIDSAHLRRLLPASLLAAAATLGGSAVGDPAIACAAPEWDIGAYDDCNRQVDQDVLAGRLTGAQIIFAYATCCVDSGGVWNADTQACGAPPAAEEPPGLPGAVGPGAGVATQNPAPPPPVVRNPGVAPRPGVITTETFAPAPIG